MLGIDPNTGNQLPSMPTASLSEGRTDAEEMLPNPSIGLSISEEQVNLGAVLDFPYPMFGMSKACIQITCLNYTD